MEAVAEGRVSPIRNLPEEHQAGGVGVAVKHVAKHYGAREQVSQELLNECLDLTVEQFGHLAVVEIVQAYRLWAAGRFKALEMYGGQFNAAQYGRVLSGYCEYRHSINQAIAGQVNAEKAELERKERKERHRREYEAKLADFPLVAQSARVEGRFTKPSVIPVTWYDFAEHHGMIDLGPEQKWALYHRAEQDLAEEYERKMDEARTAGLAEVIQRHYLSYRETAASIRAKQYAVWTLVLDRELKKINHE